MAEPTIVFLHGWGLHGGIWTLQAEGFPDRQVLAPDLPGYGLTPSVSPCDSETLAAALSAAMPAECAVVGWSLGGMVALAWAAQRPEQVRSLVLVGTSPCFVNRADWDLGLEPGVLAEFAASLTRDYRATLLRFLALQARGGDAAREVVARLRKTVFERGEPPPSLLAAGLELLARADLRAQAKEVRVPTLVIHGSRDALCPAGAGHWLAEHISGARLALHERAAHVPFLSHPRWFATILKDFLRDARY